MKTCFHFLPASLLLCLAVGAAAQTNYQEYFFSNTSPVVYRYNPALTGEGPFLSVGDVTLSSRANIGARNYYFELPGHEGLLFGLHKDVPADVFLNGLPPESSVSGSVRYSLFSYGRPGRNGGYHTFEFSTFVHGGFNLPKDLFVLLKTGKTGIDYDLSNFYLKTDSHAELTYGYSRRLSDIVSVGFRARLLVGLFSVQTGLASLSIDLGDPGWAVKAVGDLDLSGWKAGEGKDVYSYDNNKAWRARKALPSGLGASVDLGVAIRPNEYLTLSASVGNLGFMFWHYGFGGEARAEFSLTNLIESAKKHTDEDWFESLKSLARDLENQITITGQPDGWSPRPIPFNADLGVKYAMPFYDRLSAGITGHFTKYGINTYWETRLGFSVDPLDWLEATGSIGRGKYGTVWSMGVSARVERFRIQLALQDNFGAKINHTSIHQYPYNQTITLGLSYDL